MVLAGVFAQAVDGIALRERLDDAYAERVVRLGVAVRRDRDGDHDRVRQQRRRGPGGADQPDRRQPRRAGTGEGEQRDRAESGELRELGGRQRVTQWDDGAAGVPLAVRRGRERQVAERAVLRVGQRVDDAAGPRDPGQRQPLGVDQLDRADRPGLRRDRLGQLERDRAARLVEGIEVTERAAGQQLEVVELHRRRAVLRHGWGRHAAIFSVPLRVTFPTWCAQAIADLARPRGRPWGWCCSSPSPWCSASWPSPVTLRRQRMRVGPRATSTRAPTGASSAAGTTTASPSADVTTVPTNAPAGEDGPPQVPDARRADFSAGGNLPEGARIHDNESVSEGMAVRDGLLQHGRATAPDAVSSMETELDADVRKLGARVRFPGPDAGTVVLVAWQESLVDARRADRPRPPSGLRLVVDPGKWRLTAVPGDEVLASGTFTSVPGTATVEVYRDADRAWVVDPSGAVTDVADPRIGELAGPWACWQLSEKEPAQTPAVIEAVWAG